MKEKIPAKKETKSKARSKHEEWNSGSEIEFVFLPIFILSFFLDDLF